LIGGFSETIRDILNHIGFPTFVTKESDVTGISEAVDKHADFVFMADDDCFVALNLECRRVVHNADATGKGFLAGLNLMAGGLQGQAVLVIGCGAVGSSAARALLNYGAKISVYDSDPSRSRELARILEKKFNVQIKIETYLKSSLAQHRFWVEATNAADVIHGHDLTPTTYIAAPGMPIGLSRDATHKVSRRIIHDPLQIGVATMGLEALKQTLTANGI
jgi:pyrrolysine biosynthesis protein PylD